MCEDKTVRAADEKKNEDDFAIIAAGLKMYTITFNDKRHTN